jgi:hypothetical protein
MSNRFLINSFNYNNKIIFIIIIIIITIIITDFSPSFFSWVTLRLAP